MASHGEGANPDGGARGVTLRCAVLLLAVLAGSALAARDPVPLGPCGPIARRTQHIELRGMTLRRLGGTPIAKLGVVAWRNGTAEPIPFQVDERVGRQIAMSGPEPTFDDVPGVLDADDVLVFMACDAGDRAPTGTPPAAAGREIRIDDPLTKVSGWVYVVVADDPPKTEKRYVAYDPATDTVRTAEYRVGMVQALPEYFAVALGQPLGANLVDGLRLRAEAKLHGNLAGWTLTERDGRHALTAWTVGPVRVVRRSRHEVDIGLGIHLSAGIAHTYFYAQNVYGPGALKLPFSPSVFFARIDAIGGVDMRDMEGWRYRAPSTPADGFTIDGTTSDAERAFASTGQWFALTNGDRAVVVMTTLSENLARAIPLELVYVDDAKRSAPPEKEPGSVPFVAVRGRDVQKLEAGRYEFQLRIFGLRGYAPGDERTLLEQVAAPLTADVTRPADLGAARRAPR